MLKSKTDSDRMSMVARCGWEIESGGEFCGESAGPEPGYVTVGPGQRLAVRLSHRAKRVRADIVQREDGETTKQYPGAIETTVVPKTDHRRWTLRAPSNLEDANAFLIGATYRPAVRDEGDRVRSAYFLSKFRLPG